MDSNRIRLLLYLWKIDVELVINLIVTYIVQISELLRTMYIDLRHLPAAEAACRLSLKRESAHQEREY
jgi:hypothetical protein